MKNLITGVAGFIGSNLAKRLLDMGHTVVGIDNLNYGFMRNIEREMGRENFQFIMGDIANPLIQSIVNAKFAVSIVLQKIPSFINTLRNF